MQIQGRISLMHRNFWTETDTEMKIEVSNSRPPVALLRNCTETQEIEDLNAICLLEGSINTIH